MALEESDRTHETLKLMYLDETRKNEKLVYKNSLLERDLGKLKEKAREKSNEPIQMIKVSFNIESDGFELNLNNN